MNFINSIHSTSFYFIVILVFLLLIAIHIQRPAETLHFYQNLVSLVCFALKKRASITYKVFWFIKPPLIEVNTFSEFKNKSYLPVVTETYNNIKNTLNTGDLVLFVGYNTHNSYVASKWSFASPINHLGIVIKNKGDTLDIFEANLVDGVIVKDLKKKIENYPSEIIAIRRLKDYQRTDEFYAIIDRFIDEHYAKEHDLRSFQGQLEMIRSAVDLHIPFTNIEIFKNKQETIDKFFCSELIAKLFSQLGLLNLQTENQLLTSNEFTPPDFSNYGNYTLRKKEIEKRQLFDKFENEIFVLKNGKTSLAD